MLKTKVVSLLGRASLRTVGWIVMTLLAIGLFALSSQYLALNPQTYFEEQRTVYITHTTGLLIHIGGAMLAIVIGPFQFLPGSLAPRYRRLHRWLGKIYMVGVLLGGLGGLYLAPIAYGGLPAQVGFALLAVAWLFSAYMAYRHIRNRSVQLHKQWMIRNYALTFAGVTLRLWLLVFGWLGIDFVEAYILVAWLSWVPNLVFAEWMVKSSSLALRSPY